MFSCMRKILPNLGRSCAAVMRYASTAESAVPNSKPYTPRRAALYVPGNDEAKIQKIPKYNADCVILDCEDGVALNRKAEARATIAKSLDEVQFGRTETIVRVNSIASGLVDDDLRGTLAAKNLPPTLMLPKVENPSHIEQFTEKLVNALAEKKIKKKTFNLIIFIESAIGVLSLSDICRKANELTDLGAPLNLEGIVFGSDDFVANIGAERTKDARELLYVRQKIVLVAKAFQLQAIDLVHIDYKDVDGLREQAIEGARMGFTGKQVIHPIQVPIVQEAFAPSPKKVEWAMELIKAFEEHQTTGQGAFTFRGHMIDMPLLLQAKNIVQLQKLLPADAAAQPSPSAETLAPPSTQPSSASSESATKQ